MWISKILHFLNQNPIGQQIYSFIKTYVTVFLGIYLTLQSIANEPELQAV